MLSTLLQHVRYTLRMLIKNPGFSSVTILTLALGIGAATAIFSLVSGIVLRSLPFPHSEKLVTLMQSYPQKGLQNWALSTANFAHYRDENNVFSSLAAYSFGGANLTNVEKPEHLRISRVTADFFKVLDIQPILGRSFLPQEDTPGTNNVCILSYGFWQSHFGRDKEIIGRSLTLNSSSTEIVGVMPADFNFPLPTPEVWIPLGLDGKQREPWFLFGIGRLKPGISATAAEAQTSHILWTMAQEDPQLVSRNDPPSPGTVLKTLVVPLKEAIIGKTERPLLLLQAAVLLILLIVCTNIANLLLNRATVRSYEIAVRSSLGATPKHVIRQLLTESVTLSLIGCCAGIFLAWILVRSLSRLPLNGVPRVSEVSMNITVLAFAVIVAVLTGLLFGVAPALHTYKMGIKVSLNDAQRGNSKASGRTMNNVLVAGQLAMSLTLLIGAGLMLKSFKLLLAVNPGFRTDNMATMVISPAEQKYPTPEQVDQFYQNVSSDIRTIPGVSAVAVNSHSPFTSEQESDGYVIQGHEPTTTSDATQAELRIVSPGYFQTIGMSLLHGRDFLDSDKPSTPPVVVIDEILARRYWPDGNATGKLIRLTGEPNDKWYSIIGVVTGIKEENLAAPMKAHIYFPHSQRGGLRMWMVIRATGKPDALYSAVRTKLRRIDPEVVAYAFAPLSSVLDQSLSTQKLTNMLLTTFALLALILAAVGVYGVISLYVNSRTREFGIRLALGAQPANLLYSVLKEGLVLSLSGIAVGVLGGLLLSSAITSLLYQVKPADPIIFIGLAMLLLAISLITCYLPARRAARTNPLSVLHEG